MNVERLTQLTQAYGADRRRWPAFERAAAEGLLAQDASQADRLLFDARQTDAALDASPRPMVSTVLRDRVVASALAAGLTPRQARVVWDRLVLWFGAGWAAAACAGVLAGVSLTSHVTADDQTDAVVSQAMMSGMDDTEVLG